jgi:hypothetical protein
LIDEQRVFERFHAALDVQPQPGAFDRLRAALAMGSVRSRRRRLVAPFPHPGLTVAAGLLAVLLVVALVAGFLAIHWSTLRTIPVKPSIPSPTALYPPPTLTQPLSVGPEIPLILFGDSGNSLQVDGMTWDGQWGKLTRVPDAGQFTTSGTASNPAGTLFASFPNILDRSGRVVAKLAGGPYADPGVGMWFVGTWADDELHYCQVVPVFARGANPEPGMLQLTTPGGNPRDVVQIGMQDPRANTLRATACSVLADRAVVIQADPNSGPSGPLPLIQYWVVQLSNGHVLWTHDLRGRGIANVVASRDGRYVAEVQSTGTTTVYGQDGSPVGHVNRALKAFSWDGSLAVVAGGGQAIVIKWSDGTVIWTVPPGQGLSGFQPEPGGTSLAIMTLDTAHSYTEFVPRPGVIYVVSSDGRVLAQRDVASGYLLVCIPNACVPGNAV